MLTLSTAGLASLLAALLAVAIVLTFRVTRLALLAAGALLAVLGVVGVRVAADAGRTTRVVVIDASASVAGEERAVVARSGDLLGGLDGRDELSVVLFAERVVSVVPPVRVSDFDPAVAARPRASPGAGTDLAGALEAAEALLPETGRCEIVVHTDGRETRGFAAPILRRLAARGVRVTVREMGGPAAADLRVLEVTAPASGRPGDRITVVADAAGPPGAAAVVHLRREGVVVGTREVRLDPSGRARAAFADVLPAEVTLATYVASIATTSGRDPIPENDRRSAGVTIEGPPVVSLVSGSAAAARTVAAGLSRALGQSLRQLPLRDDAAIRNALRDERLAVLVLVDCPAPEVPADVLPAVAGGTGLLVVGGTRAFGPGGYADTDLERALPLRSRREDDVGMAIAVLADVSGSMTEPLDETSKARAARRAIDALVRSLPPGARVAIVPFSGVVRGATPLLDPASDADRERLAVAVADVETVGGETDLAPALEAAARLLTAEQGRRHVVVVSDGEVPASPEGLERIRRARDDLRRSGVTLGVVATATRPEALVVLEDLADGPEWFRPVRSAADLSRAFLEDLRRASGEGLEEVGPAGVRSAPGATRADAAPPAGLRLDRWLRTWLRPGGRVVLETDGEEAWPILARGRHGLGLTAAVPTTPTVGAWGPDFWPALVRSLARPRTPPGVSVRVERGPDGRAVLVLEARSPDGGFRDLERPRLTGVEGVPDGTLLRRTGAGRWQVALPTALPVALPAPGSEARIVRIVTGEEGRLLLVRSVRPPLPPELSATGPDREALRDLRDLARGAAAPAPGSRDVSWIPLLLAAALVVAEAGFALIAWGRRGSSRSAT